MSEKHTPGTLDFHPQGDANEYCLIMNDGRWVIGFRQNGELCVDEQMANARRIVATWNHCDGFTTEQVKAVSMREMVEALRELAESFEGRVGDWENAEFHDSYNRARSILTKLEGGDA